MTQDNSINSLRERLNKETKEVSQQTVIAKQNIERQWQRCSRELKKQQQEIAKDIRTRARLWLKYFPIWACGTSLLLAVIWNGFAWWIGGKPVALRKELTSLETSKEAITEKLNALELKLARNADKAKALENYDLIFKNDQLYIQMHWRDAYDTKTYTMKRYPTRVYVRAQPKK